MCTVEAMKRTRWIVSELSGVRLASEVEVIESTGEVPRWAFSYVRGRSTHGGVVCKCYQKIAACVQMSLN